MKLKKRTFLIVPATVLAAAILISGCSAAFGNSDDTPDGTTGTTPAQTAASEETTQPVQTTIPAETSTIMDNDGSGTAVREIISPADALAKLTDNENALLLDVRTQQEYDESHIPGSVLIPLQELQGRLNEIDAWKQQEVIIYCRSGRRSAEAAAILEANGFAFIYDLGGIIDWPYKTQSAEAA